MKGPSRIDWIYLALSIVLPITSFLLRIDTPKDWEVGVMQAAVFFLLLGACVQGPGKSSALLLLLLVFAVLAGISTHAIYYTQLGLVKTSTELVFFPSWSEALYFSVVTFTTLGYGDMVPREEYRLVAAFQAIQGYVFLGAFVGTLVAVFNVVPRTPPR